MFNAFFTESIASFRDLHPISVAFYHNYCHLSKGNALAFITPIQAHDKAFSYCETTSGDHVVEMSPPPTKPHLYIEKNWSLQGYNNFIKSAVS